MRFLSPRRLVRTVIKYYRPPRGVPITPPPPRDRLTKKKLLELNSHYQRRADTKFGFYLRKLQMDPTLTFRLEIHNQELRRQNQTQMRHSEASSKIRSGQI